ncbi:MAG: trehalose-6-phosphate synthase [Hyphomonas sp.]
MSRLVIFSNRVPASGPPSGGLVVALNATMESLGGLWIGTSVDADMNRREQELLHHDGSAFQRLTMCLTASEHEDYYLGYANSVLWPMLHGRMDLMDLSEGHRAAYEGVNMRLARLARSHIRTGDTLWVHDYHLIPLAFALRRLGVTNPIGFFLHTPFPDTGSVQALSNSEAFLRWFAAYDLVGLQTQQDVSRFLAAYRSAGAAQLISGNRIRWGDDIIRVGSFPIGIDAVGFREMAQEAARAHTPALSSHRLMIGVDRLDYTKGIPNRLRGLQLYLRNNPAEEDRISFVQIAPPTREDVGAYMDVRRELEQLSGEVNGEFSDIGYVPVQYIHRAIARSTISGLLRRADIALVTPLNDGMNLVAKEFVAAQDPEKPGVLVLSKFAGAAEQLGDGAVLINPHDAGSIAAGISRAARMTEDERRRRHAAMWHTINRTDADWWASSFLRALSEAAGERLDYLSMFAYPEAS